MKFRKSLFLIVSSLYVLYIFIPLIMGFTGVTINIVSVFVTVFLIIINPKTLNNKTFFWFCGYMLVLLFYFIIGKRLSLPGVMYMTEFNKFITEIAMILPTLLIFSGLVFYRDIKLIKSIAIVSIVSTLVTFVYLIPLVIQDSNILRYSLNADFRSMYIGMPTYPALHSYVTVLPALLFVFKYTQGVLRYLFLSITVIFLYVIFNTSITTTLLIALMVIVFSLIYRNNLKKTILVLGSVVVFVFFLHVSDLLIYVFDFGVYATEGTYSEGKFIGFRDSYLTGTKSSSIDVRDNLHNISIRSFLKSPIWGGTLKQIDLSLDASEVVASSKSVIGGHSSLADRLGGMGLLGFIPFIMIIITSIKTWKKFILSKNGWYYYFIGVLSAGILLYTKGLFGQEGWFTMTVYLPSVIVFCESSKHFFTHKAKPKQKNESSRY